MGVYAYLRVSTEKQDLGAQKEAIMNWALKNNLTIDEFFEDEAVSGAKSPFKRPGFKKLWEKLRPGDTLIVFELSRLGRSLRDIVFLTDELRKRGVRLVSIKENLDPSNEMQYTIMIGVLGLLAEIERQLIRERTKAGIERAKKEGKRIGRPPKIDTEKLLMLLRKGLRPKEIADILGVSVRTVYSAIQRLKKAGLVERQEKWLVRIG